MSGKASLFIEADTVKGQLINAAPGLFFAVGGLVALIIIVWKGVDIRMAAVPNDQRIAVGTVALPAAPRTTELSKSLEPGLRKALDEVRSQSSYIQVVGRALTPEEIKKLQDLAEAQKSLEDVLKIIK